jgi:cytochrome c oxidase subunit 2
VKRIGAVLVLMVVLVCGCGATKHVAPSRAAALTLTARGRQLYSDDGCAGCHSLDGSPRMGPSWRGLAGSRVLLYDGRSVTADSAYLTEHIVDPNALTVAGYPGQIMSQAIAQFDLARKPADVRALVAFIESLAG